MNISDILGTEQLERAAPDDVLRLLDGVTVHNAGDSLEGGLFGLLNRAAELFPGAFGAGLRTALSVAAVAALCAVAAGVSEGQTLRYVQLAGVLAAAALTVAGFSGAMAAGREAVAQMNVYSKALLPVLAAAAAASGNVSAAFFRHAWTALASDLLLTLYDRLLIPLMFVYAALVTFNAALPHDIVKRLAGLVKWAVAGILTVSLAVFTAYLSIGGAIAGSADAVSVKAARTALGGMVPVVGGIIADASETLLLGAAVVKNAVGVFGLLVVLGVALQPCLLLAVRAVCLKLGAALAGALGGEALADYIDSLTGLYSMMLGLVSASAFLLIISVVSTISAGL
ncbi:MAG: stage III sporulation protein AE [Oscillospiraceae bacterium]|nr:stage III sporulation protein AE [Oscillospiraceae bacterium]